MEANQLDRFIRHHARACNIDPYIAMVLYKKSTKEGGSGWAKALSPNKKWVICTNGIFSLEELSDQEIEFKKD